METYLLWHGGRQGWISNAGTSTDIKTAVRFSRDEALKRVRNGRDYQGNVTLIPVREEDLS